MKRHITTKHRHASSVRSSLSEIPFTHTARVFSSFYPAVLISPSRVTLSHRTGSQRHPITVVRVVVVAVAVVVHIAEIRSVVRRPQPPVVTGRGTLQKKTHANYLRFLYRSRSLFRVPFTRRISFSTRSIQYFITRVSNPKISCAVSICATRLCSSALAFIR